MFEKLITDKFLKQAEKLSVGQLKVILPDEKKYEFSGREAGPEADIIINDWGVIANALNRGDIAFAEDYRDGKWKTSNLVNLLEVALENKAAFERFVAGDSIWRFVYRLSYLLKANTVNGSRKNIHAHYDIGNDFYKLWLDETMTYSAAIFDAANQNLEQAQHNKYDRIINRLGRESGNVLEVGCGWGGFADRALAQKDFGIKGITLSQEQHDYAVQRLGQNAQIALEDYRHQDGKYDSIVSIEMFEAVGERYWKTYFDKIESLLTQSGKAIVQTITIGDEYFDRYRKGGDFIRTYIFPGGMLPTSARFSREAERSGLKVNDEYFFGQDYAETLKRWLKNFDERKKDIMALGFDEKFIRLWRFYLAACVAGFTTKRTDVMQVELVRA